MKMTFRSAQFIATFAMLLSVLGGAGWVSFTSVQAEEEAELKPIQFEDPKLGRPVDFEEDVLPILEDNCISCHNLGNDESKLNLEELETIMQGGKRGASVVIGKPDESLLYQVSARHKKPFMPPLPNEIDAEELTPIQLGILRQWIIEGAKGSEEATGPEIAWQPLPEHLQAIYSVALSPWGQYVAVGRANRISLFDLSTQQQVSQFSDPNLTALKSGNNPFYKGNIAHRDFVHALAYSPDGRTIASGDYRVIKLWQRTDTPLSRQFELPQDIVTLATAPNNQQAAVALVDHSIAIVNLADGKVLKTLTGHADKISQVHFIANDQLVSISADRTLRLWNTTTGTQVAIAESTAALTTVTAGQGGQPLLTGNADGKIQSWTKNEAAYQAAQEWPTHKGNVTGLALFKDGKRLASTGVDGTVRVRVLADGKETLNQNHGAPISSLLIRPDQLTVITGAENGSLKSWQVTDGKMLAETKTDLALVQAKLVTLQNFEVSKQLLANADTTLKAAEKNLTEREESLKKSQENLEKSKKAVPEAVTKLKEANEALTAAKAELEKAKENADLKKKVDAADKKAKDSVKAVETAKKNLVSAERSAKLAAEALVKAKALKESTMAAKAKKEEEKNAAEKLDLAAQEAIKANKAPVRTLSYLNAGKQIVSTSETGQFQLTNPATMKAISTVNTTVGKPVALSSLGGAQFITASGKTVSLFDLTPRWELAATLGAAADDPLNSSASPFSSRVLTLAFSPDGKYLAAGGGDPSRTGELIIWDVEKREVKMNIADAHSDTVLTVSFSRDGKYLLSGAADKFVKAHTVADGKFVRSFEGHTHHVLGVTWKADGATIASSSADNTVKVWNFETGEQKRTISGFGKQVTAIKFIGTGDKIVDSSGDKSVRLHNSTNGKAERTFAGGTDFMYVVDTTRDGGVVVSGGEDGTLRVWNGADAKSLFTVAPAVKK